METAPSSLDFSKASTAQPFGRSQAFSAFYTGRANRRLHRMTFLAFDNEWGVAMLALIPEKGVFPTLRASYRERETATATYLPTHLYWYATLWTSERSCGV